MPKLDALIYWSPHFKDVNIYPEESWAKNQILYTSHSFLTLCSEFNEIEQVSNSSDRKQIDMI